MCLHRDVYMYVCKHVYVAVYTQVYIYSGYIYSGYVYKNSFTESNNLSLRRDINGTDANLNLAFAVDNIIGLGTQINGWKILRNGQHTIS